MAKQPESRRRQAMDAKDPGEKLDQTPIEIPMGAHIPKMSLAAEIQQQIAIQLAKKHQGASS